MIWCNTHRLMRWRWLFVCRSKTVRTVLSSIQHEKTERKKMNEIFFNFRPYNSNIMRHLLSQKQKFVLYGPNVRLECKATSIDLFNEIHQTWPPLSHTVTHTLTHTSKYSHRAHHEAHIKWKHAEPQHIRAVTLRCRCCWWWLLFRKTEYSVNIKMVNARSYITLDILVFLTINDSLGGTNNVPNVGVFFYSFSLLCSSLLYLFIFFVRCRQ